MRVSASRVRTISKSTFDAYLRQRSSRSRLQMTEGDPVYDAALFLLENPGINESVREKFNLTEQEYRRVHDFTTRTRAYVRRVSRGLSIYS